MDNLVTLLTFNNIADSYIPQSILESYEIPCVVTDGIMGQLYVATAIGGIKLQVLERDYQRARKIVEEAGYTVED